MPQPDPCSHIPLHPRLTDSLSAHGAFISHLPPGGHLLNGLCDKGDDLIWLRQQGYMVTACDPQLHHAKAASQRAGQAVRVSPLAQMRSVLPYDGIWISRPLVITATDPADGLATLLQPLTGLLKPAAPLYFALCCETASEHNNWGDNDTQITAENKVTAAHALNVMRVQHAILRQDLALQQVWLTPAAVGQPPASQFLLLRRGDNVTRTDQLR